jgi:hypothetical protein
MRNVLAVVLCIAIPLAMFAKSHKEVSSEQAATSATQDNSPKVNQGVGDADKARVFITDSESWSIGGWPTP